MKSRLVFAALTCFGASAFAGIPVMNCQIVDASGQVLQTFHGFTPRSHCCIVEYTASKGQLDFQYGPLASSMEVNLSQNPWQPFQPIWSKTLNSTTMTQAADGNISGELDLSSILPGEKLVCKESRQ